MQRIRPHSLDDSTDVAPEIKFIPELGMTTRHLDI